MLIFDIKIFVFMLSLFIFIGIQLQDVFVTRAWPHLWSFYACIAWVENWNNHQLELRDKSRRREEKVVWKAGRYYCINFYTQFARLSLRSIQQIGAYHQIVK